MTVERDARASTVPDRRDRAVAIKDVARLAQVAVGTVSNVLNRPETVTPATRRRVEESIRALGYVPNPAARRLRNGVSTTVGVVVLDMANPFFTEMARGVQDRLDQDSFGLMLAGSDEAVEREHRYVDLFVDHGVRGVLVTPARTDLDHLRRLRDRGIGVVLLDHYSTELPSVGVDDVAGGAMATTHLLDAGHERVALFTGPREVRQCAARREGVVRALLAHGLDPAATLVETVLAAPLTHATGEAATHELLDRAGAPPTAILCVNDVLAIGVLRALRDRGVDVPRDIAVVGYDDIGVASMLSTPLTTVRQPSRTIGFHAARILLNDPDTDDHLELTPELVVRASSDAAAR